MENARLDRRSDARGLASSRPRPPRCWGSSTARPATSRRSSTRCSRRRYGFARRRTGHLFTYDGECFHPAAVSGEQPRIQWSQRVGTVRPGRALRWGASVAASASSILPMSGRSRLQEPIRAPSRQAGARSSPQPNLSGADQGQHPIGAMVIFRQEVRPFSTSRSRCEEFRGASRHRDRKRRAGSASCASDRTELGPLGRRAARLREVSQAVNSTLDLETVLVHHRRQGGAAFLRPTR